MATKTKFEKLANGNEIQKKINPGLAQESLDYFFYFLKVFFTVGIIYLFIRTSVFDVIGISGKSMFPNYDDQDAIYIDQLTPHFGEYRRGDVVVLLAPPDLDGRRSLFIKRIIGLPGERVAFEDGNVYIYNDNYPSGIILEESDYLMPEIKTFKRIITGGERFEEELLQDNEYFVLGDNRTGSTDSRFFGKIQSNQILGREFYRVLPSEKSGFFDVPEYNIEN